MEVALLRSFANPSVCTKSTLPSPKSLHGSFRNRSGVPRSNGICFFTPDFRPPLFAKTTAKCSFSGGDSAAKVDDEAEQEIPVVEVIGIGSRKDAFVDFCLRTPLRSSGLRFWTIRKVDSGNVLVQQEAIGKGFVQSDADGFLSAFSSQEAVILVAGAGYGTEIETAMQLIRAVEHRGCLIGGVILKPFIFEQKRQLEVKKLVSELRHRTNFCIFVETDALLEREAVTLAEALVCSNKAALLAVNCISCLLCENYPKFIVSAGDALRKVGQGEIKKILKGIGEAQASYGTGYDIKSALENALTDCSFSKERDAAHLCIILRSCSMVKGDLYFLPEMFELITGDATPVVVSCIVKPDLEPDLVVATIVHTQMNTTREDYTLLSLAQRLPFVSFFKNIKSFLNLNASRTQVTDMMQVMDFLQVDPPVSLIHHHSQAEGHQSPQQQTEEKQSAQGEPFPFDQLTPYSLPVGVKPFAQSQTQFSDTCMGQTSLASSQHEFFPSEDTSNFHALTELGSGQIKDFCSSSAAPLVERCGDGSKKQGVLSTRASLMLEAEGESAQKWTPFMEMQYRGGLYKGRSKGGLPEGKGRLTFSDGSFYDGMWRLGKKSGLGSFYYSNGDVFQGSWRDDLMHGKGWLYFHTGDRWFAPFWKSKANGEARFYSQDGSAFFGNFEDGWRHGQCLHIHADGRRWMEVWDEGVLVSRQLLNS